MSQHGYYLVGLNMALGMTTQLIDYIMSILAPVLLLVAASFCGEREPRREPRRTSSPSTPSDGFF